MAIKNEDAMRDLIERKRKASLAEPFSSYWDGVFIGASGAYLQAGVITYDQFKSLHIAEATNVKTEADHVEPIQH